MKYFFTQTGPLPMDASNNEKAGPQRNVCVLNTVNISKVVNMALIANIACLAD